LTSEVKNILIIKPSALGDIALSLPALTSVRKSFPNAKITWLVRKEYAPLLSMTGNVDDVLIFDRKLLGKCYRSLRSLKELIRFIIGLRRPKFDLVIDLQGLFRTAFFAFLTGSKRRFGMKPSREFSAIFYTDRIEYDEKNIHLIDFYSKIIYAVGADEIVYDYELSPDAETMGRAESLLKEKGLGGRPYAVFVTGAAHKRKCWPIEYFAELADKLKQEFGLSVVAVGTDTERPHIQKLKSMLDSELIDLAGKTSIPVLAAVMKNANVVVSNDTGPGHIAEAVGSKLVMIFGPTNPARIHPYKKPGAIAAIDPFGRGKEIGSSSEEYTIDKVKVETVFRKISCLLTDQKNTL